MALEETFCAFCGALVERPDFLDDFDDEDEPEEDGLEWMGDVVLITEDKHAALAQDRVYITGTATYEDFHKFDVEGHSALVVAYNFDETGDDADAALAVPFHRPCYDLFCRQLASTPDPNILYAAFKALLCSVPKATLDLDYGPMDEVELPFPEPRTGTEALVAHPLDVPLLDAYCSSLPRLTIPAVSDDGTAPICVRSRQPSDWFGRLPPEILHLIMSHLELQSVHHFRLSSRAASSLTLGRAFWKHHVWHDMPWLFDLPQLESESSQEPIDWARVYRDLTLASRYKHAKTIPGLCNRRRIWQTSQQIAHEYLAQKRLKEAATERIGAAADAFSSPMTIITDPQPKGKQVVPLCVSLLTRYEDFATEQPTIMVHWASDGNLIGIQVQHNDGSILPDRPFASHGIDFTVDKVTIPLDDWLLGCVVTIRESKSPSIQGDPRRAAIGLKLMFTHHDPVQLGSMDGDQRLFQASAGNFIVGLEAECYFPGTLAKLSLLEQPVAKLPNNKCTERLENPKNHGLYSKKIQKHLWRQTLPLPNLEIFQYHKGHSSGRNTAMAAMETLMFGTSEEELSKIVSFSGEMQLGGFVVRYSDGSRREIGPNRHAMRSLAIDGRGGERVIAVSWAEANLPEGFSCVTNYGRQLVVGSASWVVNKRGPLSSTKGIQTVAGFFASWQSPKALLDSVGVFYDSDANLNLGANQQEVVDAKESFWDPEPPPSRLVESGKIWGGDITHRALVRMREAQKGTFPDTLYWMDCCRLLESVTVTLCHGVSKPQLPLTAIKFQHSDGGRDQIVGPDTFAPPTVTKGATGHAGCWCAHGNQHTGELEATDHYTHHKWDVGGNCLRSLRLWIDGSSEALSGIQFVATNDQQSPVWGYGSGEHTAEIRFGGPAEGDVAQGLKFFANQSNRSSKGHIMAVDSMITVAIQALATGAPMPAKES